MSESATSTLAKLVEQRERASARVDDLEAQARAAGQTLAAASEALIALERQGGGAPADRRKAEAALADAKATAAEPWAERAEGARRGVRDAQQQIAVHVGANLPALVESLEADGEVAAARLNAACEALLAAYAEREAIASRIFALVSMQGRARPGDVSGSDAGEVAGAAQRLIQNGGEQGPTLRRDRYPGLVEQAVVESEHEHAVA